MTPSSLRPKSPSASHDPLQPLGVADVHGLIADLAPEGPQGPERGDPILDLGGQFRQVRRGFDGGERRPADEQEAGPVVLQQVLREGQADPAKPAADQVHPPVLEGERAQLLPREVHLPEHRHEPLLATIGHLGIARRVELAHDEPGIRPRIVDREVDVAAIQEGVFQRDRPGEGHDRGSLADDLVFRRGRLG